MQFVWVLSGAMRLGDGRATTSDPNPRDDVDDDDEDFKLGCTESDIDKKLTVLTYVVAPMVRFDTVQMMCVKKIQFRVLRELRHFECDTLIGVALCDPKL